MKNSKLILVLVFLISSIATYAIPEASSNKEVTKKIQTFLTSIDYSHLNNEATVFNNFIVSEDGDLFNVDFMITENDEIVVLSKDYEEEYYKVELYNSNFTTQYSLPVAYVNPE